MPIELTELVRAIRPENTVLFLGAGSSIPSGAPSAAELAAQLSRELTSGKVVSDDLLECASILGNRYGRASVVSQLRKILINIKPTGGLVSLPCFGWHSLYTTNFDDLIEKAYQQNRRPIVPIRSNYDIAKAEPSRGTPLFKMHGCISQDLVDGSKARMIITERDYDEYKLFRESLYKRLAFDLLTKSVVFIGYSLKDAHLREQIKKAAIISEEGGAPGKIYVLIYERDDDRALLLERQLVRVAFSGVDQFCYQLSVNQPDEALVYQTAPVVSFAINPRLRTCTLDVIHAQSLPANASRMFNGRPATYGDIVNGLTFRRSVARSLLQSINGQEIQFAVITGAAGVGKTSLGRQLLCHLSDHGVLCWEHQNDFPFSSDDWIDVDRELRDVGRKGALFIDECTLSLYLLPTRRNGLHELKRHRYSPLERRLCYRDWMRPKLTTYYISSTQTPT